MKRNGQDWSGSKFEVLNDAVYEGDLKNGVPHGQGCCTFPDGAVFKGELKNGVPHGQGCFTYPSGAVYEGEFKDGKQQGPGCFTYPVVLYMMAAGQMVAGMVQGPIHMSMEANIKESGREPSHPSQVEISRRMARTGVEVNLRFKMMLYMKETSRTGCQLDKAAAPSLLGLFKKESGRMGGNKDQATSLTLMVLYMMESGRMGRDMDQAASPTLMVLYMKETSRMGRNMEKAVSLSLLMLYM